MELNRKLWFGLSILGAIALISSAAVFGGIEWALASLGLITLIMMVVIGIHIAVKISKYTDKSIYSEPLKYARSFASTGDAGDGKTTGKIPEKLTPISKKDRKFITTHIDELFAVKTKGEGQKDLTAEPISKRDKRLIMAHIDDLFETRLDHSEERLY